MKEFHYTCNKCKKDWTQIFPDSVAMGEIADGSKHECLEEQVYCPEDPRNSDV